MNPPRPAQVIELLDLLTWPESVLTYLHCEAGKGPDRRDDRVLPDAGKGPAL